MKSLEDLIERMELIPVDEIAYPDREDLPWVTHEGYLIIGDYTLEVIQLNTGQRFIPDGCIHRIFGTMGGEIL